MSGSAIDSRRAALKYEWRTSIDYPCDEDLYVDGEYFGLICKNEKTVLIVWDGQYSNFAPTIEQAKTFLEKIAAEQSLVYRKSIGDFDPYD